MLSRALRIFVWLPRWPRPQTWARNCPNNWSTRHPLASWRSGSDRSLAPMSQANPSGDQAVLGGDHPVLVVFPVKKIFIQPTAAVPEEPMTTLCEILFSEVP